MFDNGAADGFRIFNDIFVSGVINLSRQYLKPVRYYAFISMIKTPRSFQIIGITERIGNNSLISPTNTKFIGILSTMRCQFPVAILPK